MFDLFNGKRPHQLLPNGGMFTAILVFLSLFVFESMAHVGLTDGQTDRRTTPVMQPTRTPA